MGSNVTLTYIKCWLGKRNARVGCWFSCVLHCEPVTVLEHVENIPVIFKFSYVFPQVAPSCGLVR